MKKTFYFYYLPHVGGNNFDYLSFRELIEPSSKISLYKKFTRAHTIYDYISCERKLLEEIFIIQDTTIDSKVFHFSSRRPILAKSFLVSQKEIDQGFVVKDFNLSEFGYIEERSIGYWDPWSLKLEKLVRNSICFEEVRRLSIF